MGVSTRSLNLLRCNVNTRSVRQKQAPRLKYTVIDNAGEQRLSWTNTRSKEKKWMRSDWVWRSVPVSALKAGVDLTDSNDSSLRWAVRTTSVFNINSHSHENTGLKTTAVPLPGLLWHCQFTSWKQKNDTTSWNCSSLKASAGEQKEKKKTHQ